MEKYDIIVVGAGPSGTISSYVLAKNGFKVLLIDKEKFPRYKPCGGAITEKTINLLKTEDLFNENIIERSCKLIDIYLRNKYITTIKINSPISIIDRIKFDYFLLKNAIEAGTIFHDKENVIGVSYNTKEVQLITDKMKYSSEFIIGADGVNSKIAILSGIRKGWNIDELEIASQAFGYFSSNKIDSINISLFFGYIPYGYGWAFPLKDKLNIGIGTHMKFSSFLINAKNHYFSHVAKKFNINIRNVYYHLLSIGNNKHRKLAKNRIFLIGDAAGLVDPWIGEGIYYALLSGLIVSKVIEKFFSSEKPEIIYFNYEKEIYKILKNQYYSYEISKKFYKHINLNLKLIKNVNLFSKYLSILLNGKLSYIELYKKLHNPIRFLIDILTM